MEENMIKQNSFPILEFDTDKDAKLNPTHFVAGKFETDQLVITFFPEVIDRLIRENAILPEKTIGGENPVYVYHFVEDTGTLITLGKWDVLPVGVIWICLMQWESTR